MSSQPYIDKSKSRLSIIFRRKIQGINLFFNWLNRIPPLAILKLEVLKVHPNPKLLILLKLKFRNQQITLLKNRFRLVNQLMQNKNRLKRQNRMLMVLVIGKNS